MIKLKGTVMWAFLNKENEMSGKYQLDICHLSEKAVEALEATGMKVKLDSEKGHFITPKSKFPIVAVDKDGDEIVGVKVGNGSECGAVIDTYAWSNPRNKKEKGVSPRCTKLVITDLIEYASAETVTVDVEDDDIL